MEDSYFNSISDAFSLTEDTSIADNAFIKDCSSAFTCRALTSSADNYSTGTTFFIRADENPKCLLEEVALSIFKHYTADMSFDAMKSGAEWWTQVIDSEDEIGVHWDRFVYTIISRMSSIPYIYTYVVCRDYGLEGECGMHIYPYRGTVSYFSTTGAPTLVFTQCHGTATAAEDITGEVSPPYVLSFPRMGKHIAFDGKCLHGRFQV